MEQLALTALALAILALVLITKLGVRVSAIQSRVEELEGTGDRSQ